MSLFGAGALRKASRLRRPNAPFWAQAWPSSVRWSRQNVLCLLSACDTRCFEVRRLADLPVTAFALEWQKVELSAVFGLALGSNAKEVCRHGAGSGGLGYYEWFVGVELAYLSRLVNVSGVHRGGARPAGPVLYFYLASSARQEPLAYAIGCLYDC